MSPDRVLDRNGAVVQLAHRTWAKAVVMTEHLSVEMTCVDDLAVVVLAGQLDAASAPMLEQELSKIGQHVIIDCASVTFIDSSGLTAILRQRMRLEMQGHRLRLRSPSPAVRQVLSLTGIGGLEES
jgi:anti-anti-sigma factor